MLNRFAILGLVLLALGGGVLGWVLNERETQRQKAASYKLKYGDEPDEYLNQYSEWLKLSPQQREGMPLQVNGCGQAKSAEQVRSEQQERLAADIDRLATGELDAHPFADVLYGEDWKEQVEKYKKRKELSEFVLTGSVVCTSIGGVTFGWCLILWIARLLISGASRLKRSCAEDGYCDDEADDRTDGMHGRQTSATAFVRAARAGAGQLSVGAGPDQEDSQNESDPSRATGKAKRRKRIPVFVSGKKSNKPEKAPAKNMGQGVSAMEHSGGARKDALMLEKSLRAHAEKLERQMEEFRRMHDAAQSATEQAKPLNGALEELTQQVSAIREYASHQQERVEKLQDGYDWNIVRTFCLRVIRCIDNLESRIERLSEEDGETGDLEEVRDELIFALESSGVEQFSPEVNSPYRGQEKSIEAVKERERCKDPEKSGMIAKVVRPGYQYFIDESNLKVVRAAQVKLFE